MLKNFYLKVICFMLAFVTSVSTLNVPAIAASPNGEENVTESVAHQKRMQERAERIAKFPDRVAEVVVYDEATSEQIKTKFFLTPDTTLDQSAFKGLKRGYRLDKVHVRPLSEDEALALEPEFVETIFDVGNFVLSLTEFNKNPTFWNGFWVVMDGASVVFPGVPSVSGVKTMVESSLKLKTALQVGIMPYGTLKYKTIPTGWERHHIIEKRFAEYLGWDYSTNENNMFAIPMKAEDHKVVTNILRQKIPYDTAYIFLTDSAILKAHKEAYYQMYYETSDQYWKFLANFVETGQWK